MTSLKNLRPTPSRIAVTDIKVLAASRKGGGGVVAGLLSLFVNKCCGFVGVTGDWSKVVMAPLYKGK